MSWVLILSPNGNDKWPAVVGGYKTREEAVAAGEVATGPPEHLRNCIGSFGYAPVWISYTVIPGAAAQ